MLLPSEMITEFRNHLDAVGSNFFSGEEVMRRLFDAQQRIVRDIVTADPSFFIARADLSLVAGTALYSLPLNARAGTRFLFSETSPSSVSNSQTWQAHLRDFFIYNAPGVGATVNEYSFAVENGQVRVMPTPTVSQANAIRVWYSPNYGNMIEGSVLAATATTVQVYTTPNWTTSFGKVSNRDDYYNGMSLHVVSGTGAGQTQEVLDYAGSTRTFTTATWTTTPDATSVVAVLCPIPEDHHGVVPLMAAYVGSAKNRNRQGELRDLLFGIPGGMHSELMNWINKRQDDILEVVEVSYAGEY